MQKIILIAAAVLLAACTEQSSEAKWVAQALPSNEQLQAVTLHDAKVDIYTSTTNTTGYVIYQDERDKWILVNAEHVAANPYSLVHAQSLILAETYAIDPVHNIAILHMRNSLDYSNGEIDSFKTNRDNKDIVATKHHIDRLLDEARNKKIDWKQRLSKNNELLPSPQHHIDNFTKYYDKNIFTYNMDELKAAGMHFIEQLNESIKTENRIIVNTLVASDDVSAELLLVKKPILGFHIKEAWKDGVYYIVDGVNEENEEVRLTFINSGQQYKVIGANFISAEHLEQEKIPLVKLMPQEKIEAYPALIMFLHGHIPAIHAAVGDIVWELQHRDTKVAVSNGTAKFTCSSIEKNENYLVLNDCINTKNSNYIIATFEK